MSKRIKVLITDDNRHFCNILKEIVEKDHHFDVVGMAHDGVTALDMIRMQKPDLVILDIIMPMLDGLGVLEKYKSMQSDHRVQFIVMSAVGHDDITFRAINLGASYYVVKPFDMVEFMRRLRQFAIGKGPDSVMKDQQGIDSLEPSVVALLKEIGIPMHIKGYQYIQDAVMIVLKDATALGRVTKAIYPSIAQKYETTPSRVERAIRNAIDLTLARGNRELMTGLFNTEELGEIKITNSEFIAILSEKLRMEVR